MKKNLIMLAGFLLIALLLLSSCGGPSVNTDENAALVLESSLARFLDMKPGARHASIPEEPWIILRKNRKDEWRVIGSSLEELSPDALSGIRTVIRCDSKYIHESYRLSGVSAGTGTSEYVEMYFFDAQSGDYYDRVCIPPKELPNSASKVPDYTISDGTVLKTIRNRFELGISAADMPEDMKISGTVFTKYENKRITDETAYNRCTTERFKRPFYVPRSVTKIGPSAFSKTFFPQYVLGENVTSVEKGAFSECENMTEMDLSHVQELGERAFSGCEKLEKLILGDQITEVKYSAFSGCASLKEVDLSRVQKLGELAFSDCTSLEKAVLSDSGELTEHIAGIFLRCRALREVIVPESNPSLMSRDGVIYSRDGRTLLFFPEGAEVSLQKALEGVETLGRDTFESFLGMPGCPDGKVTLDSLKAIERNAFYHNEGIRELTLGGEVPELENAFSKCTNLERVVITAQLKTLGKSCFNDCESLRELVLPDTLETIEYCLSGCPELKEVRIPPSVTKIDPAMFTTAQTRRVLVVTPGSYAEEFAVQNSLEYRTE